MAYDRVQALLQKCLYIQSRGHGDVDFPFVAFETSNYGSEIWIKAYDNGFDYGAGRNYDLEYKASFNSDFSSDDGYLECIEHLNRLIEKVDELEKFNNKKELTVEEIEKLLGYGVKIVGSAR